MVVKVGVHVTMIIALREVYRMEVQSYLVSSVVEVEVKTLLVQLQVVVL